MTDVEGRKDACIKFPDDELVHWRSIKICGHVGPTVPGEAAWTSDCKAYVTYDNSGSFTGSRERSDVTCLMCLSGTARKP
jgi:hypothetical protein